MIINNEILSKFTVIHLPFDVNVTWLLSCYEVGVLQYYVFSVPDNDPQLIPL